jgi:hypothetical protein
MMDLKLGRKVHFRIYSIVLVTLSSGLHLKDGPGEDIARSRSTFQSGQGSDFLGGFASIFYSSIPNLFFEWWQLLIIIQATLAGFGVYLLFRKMIENVDIKYLIIIVIFSYIVLNLAVAQTRDGIMIAATFFALGTINLLKQSKLAVITWVATFIFAFTFRPWLSIAILPLIFFHVRYRMLLKLPTTLIFCVLLGVAPIILEVIFTREFSIKPGYPQQTVMIHDLTSTLCLSPIPKTREMAYKGLVQLAYDKNSFKNLCNFYKPNTWQSSITPNSLDPMTPSIVPPLSIIKPGDESSYQILKSNWIELIIFDPKSYFQNHLYFLTQVLISGESPSFNLKKSYANLSKNSTPLNLVYVGIDIFDLPWKILIQLHLLAPIFTYAFLGIIYRRRSYNFMRPILFCLLCVITIWVSFTTFGFVSDNGRYTYLPSLIIYGQFLVEANRFKRSIS